MNSLEYRVETSSGSVVTSEASIFLLNNTAKIVVSDIDGTVTKYYAKEQCQCKATHYR